MRQRKRSKDTPKDWFKCLTSSNKKFKINKSSKYQKPIRIKPPSNLNTKSSNCKRRYCRNRSPFPDWLNRSKTIE